MPAESRQKAKLSLQSELGLALWFWGRGTLAGERGGGRVPIPMRGHSLWYSLFIFTFCLVIKLTKETRRRV